MFLKNKKKILIRIIKGNVKNKKLNKSQYG